MAFLLPPGAGAGEIIGGQEAQPHSRPYMAYLKIQCGNEMFSCGGFLVAENFVLTAAHCEGDEISVTLGAHRISEQERSQRKLPVRRQIRHPRYNRETTNNDITLLQGDSGGPLVCCGVAEGIVSKGIENSTGPPAVYTRISHFMPWITDTMRGI
ncbi:cathepsin G-like [Malaclemys terrapin pileata]|uniref:cathepsin G-like n=1 Tax=Malaclemys terrapin pileata TaxID=2991368 RepID=UPI0023A898BE|nr:cathepsin G-like [Malaclemys terrapin pileata]